MYNPNKAIGIIDSGIGGLTVLKEIQKAFPDEKIIYLGDNKNCPYGNMDKDEILNLSRRMLNHLKNENIQVAAIACNTISSAGDELSMGFDFEIVDIITPTVEYIHREKFMNIGILATEFTVKSGMYEKMIKEKNPLINIVSQESKDLASIVDEGDLYSERLDNEIRLCIEALLKKSPLVKDIVLACTHYPIVKASFEKAFPNLNFINPALMQSSMLKCHLNARKPLDALTGSVDIYTSGNVEIYQKICRMLEIQNINIIKSTSF